MEEVEGKCASQSPLKVNLSFSMWGGPRPDPPNLGMKEIPKGEPNCLYGKTFLFTGIGDSLQRDDAFALVEHYGG